MRHLTRKNFIIIFVWVILILLLLYTRFVNLSWGFPYAMHPDERNMAVAIQALTCETQNSQIKIENCFNPHFFAYGQFPLYLSYLFIFINKILQKNLGITTTFIEAVMSLRVIAALASVINAFVLLETIKLLVNNINVSFKVKIQDLGWQILIGLTIIFSPFFIQSSHFGTTESLLMLFYSLTLYFSLKIILTKILNSKFLILNSLWCGLAMATKVSSIIFLIIPLIAVIYKTLTNSRRPSWKWLNGLFIMIKFILLTVIFFIIFSPHNIISLNEFIGSMRYESDVAFGHYLAFYTRQFDQTVPFIFQFFKIFPYTLGWPAFILFLWAFIFLPWRAEINLLRLAFLFYFLPNSVLYAKWTRFMAPLFPLMLVMAGLSLVIIYDWISSLADFFYHLAFGALIVIFITPGLAFLSIYQNPDIRFSASQWIYKNIAENAYVLSETANVVDIPFAVENGKNHKNYQVISFNFYELDNHKTFQDELKQHLIKADYILIPSRRIFMNHACGIEQKSKLKNHRSKIKDQRCLYLKEKYPVLNRYYQDLFSGVLGFVKVAELNSYPKINLFGKTIIAFPDEEAEETWTVFDHPVIRIYKKISKPSILMSIHSRDIYILNKNSKRDIKLFYS